jgi:hypothetical protein
VTEQLPPLENPQIPSSPSFQDELEGLKQVLRTYMESLEDHFNVVEISVAKSPNPEKSLHFIKKMEQLERLALT